MLTSQSGADAIHADFHRSQDAFRRVTVERVQRSRALRDTSSGNAEVVRMFTSMP
jgi:hypothetical protein